MAIDKKIHRRGLWKQEVLQPTLEEDYRELSKRECFTRGNEGTVRRFIEEMVNAATVELAKLGYPTKPGVYQEMDDGSYVWHHEVGSQSGIVVDGKTSLWPHFLKGEPLSKESFAVNLIFRATMFLQATEKSNDAWHTAAVALEFAHAYFNFRVEFGGIGKRAEQGIANLGGLYKARSSASSRRSEGEVSIEFEALAILKDSVHPIDAKTLAFLIVDRLKKRNLPPIRGNGGASLKVETIQRRIQQMRNDGRLLST